MNLSDLKPYMTHHHCFTRWTVSRVIADMRGEKSCKQYDYEAGKILRAAKSANEIRFIQGRARSCYYEFVAKG
jgi:hypothetical protein